jgi:hypothetical protein
VNREIKEAGFQKSLPEKASPSAKYFWSARRRSVKKAPKIQTSTHQFPALSVIGPKPEFFSGHTLKFDTGCNLDLEEDFGRTCTVSTDRPRHCLGPYDHFAVGAAVRPGI